MTTQSTQASPRTALTAVDPSTGAVVREVPAATPAQIDAVLDRARSAFLAWRETSFEERAALLEAVAAHLREHVEELAPLMTEEMGKPIGEARGEVGKAATISPTSTSPPTRAPPTSSTCRWGPCWGCCRGTPRSGSPSASPPPRSWPGTRR